ncbi:MAG: hypothetical protein OXS28_20935 [Gammaproteobacteria bacterium]|nr:hypothetical protein [Gammaproteobacteria bacterium]
MAWSIECYNTDVVVKVLKLMKHEQLKLKALSDPDVKAEYDALKPEFALLRERLSAREKTGLSQEEITVRMGTITPT